jgi:hypothetical protein
LPVPLQTPFPAESAGGVQVLDKGQFTGLVTMTVFVAQPLVDVAVIVTSVPVGMPVTVLPVIVPADAVTIPLLLNLTL